QQMYKGKLPNNAKIRAMRAKGLSIEETRKDKHRHIASNALRDQHPLIPFPKYWDLRPLRTYEPIETPDHTVRITLYNNQFHICIPSKPSAPLISECKEIRACAIDPGVRKFATVYDMNEGHCTEFGAEGRSRLAKLCYNMDRLLGRMAKCKRKRRLKSLEKARCRLSQRIQNIRNEFHCQISNYLTNTYDLILLPIFKTKEMSAKTRRKITKKTTRQMLTWAHYKFQQRILNQAAARGKCVILVCERYTTKQGQCCGWMHEKIGSDETFKCRQCHSQYDRDHGSSRGVALKWISDGCPIDIKTASTTCGATPLGLHPSSERAERGSETLSFV
ncbi:MAG: transposase, partial [Hymenobacter sp.]